MRKIISPAALIALLVIASPSFAQELAPPRSGGQKRFLSVADSLEAAPLDPQLRTERAWAMLWLINAPDVSVTACLDPLGGMSIKSFSHGSEIIAQYTLSMAAFIIRHPKSSNDSAAQQIAGVESALKAYQVMRTAEPSDKSPPLERLLEAQRNGELTSAVRTAYLRCNSNPDTVSSPTNPTTTAIVWDQIWDEPGIAVFYADRSNISGAGGVRSITTRARYQEPLPEGYISERIRVEDFDCQRHRSRVRRSMIFGKDGRAPQTVEWTAEEASWTATEAGSLGRKKESVACDATSD